MTRRLFLALPIAVFVVLGGCANPNEDGNPSTDGIGQPAPSTAVDRALSALGINMTSCRGAIGGTSVPTALVADDIPSPYAAHSSTQAVISMDLTTCDKIAIEGIDRGPAVLVVLEVTIKEPSDAPKGDHDASVYVLEMITDNQFLSTWLQNSNMIPALKLTYSMKPFQADYGELKINVLVSSTAKYSVEAYPETRTSPNSKHVRWFFGANPVTDYWDMKDYHDESVADGHGSLTAAPDSRLAEILEGVTTLKVVMSHQLTNVREIKVPAPPQE